MQPSMRSLGGATCASLASLASLAFFVLGCQGEAGPKGDPGDRGEIGPQGQQGIPGNPGDRVLHKAFFSSSNVSMCDCQTGWDNITGLLEVEEVKP